LAGFDAPVCSIRSRFQEKNELEALRFDAQLAHLGLERGALQPKFAGSSLIATDFPGGIAESADDGLAFGRPELMKASPPRVRFNSRTGTCSVVRFIASLAATP
jgi:hypothetical protein